MSNIRDEYQEAHENELVAGIHVCDVVSVLSFDRKAMTVDVMPLSKRLEEGKYQSQPPICSVPVIVHCGGGFLLVPAYKVGDVGIVIYADHDIDAVLDGEENEPNTDRTHDQADAFFIGGFVPATKAVKSIPVGAAGLAALDGSAYILLSEGKISIKGDVSIDGSLVHG